MAYQRDIDDLIILSMHTKGKLASSSLKTAQLAGIVPSSFVYTSIIVACIGQICFDDIDES